MIQPTLLLGLPAHLRLDQIEIAPQTLILSLAVETSEAACPLCQLVSHRVHSHYTRTLADLPCGGKACGSWSWFAASFAEMKPALGRFLPNGCPN
jgi:hypothetical protein